LRVWVVIRHDITQLHELIELTILLIIDVPGDWLPNVALRVNLGVMYRGQGQVVEIDREREGEIEGW
jgi:hypothetical protein